MRMFKDVSFNSPPIMLAAWPGMGNVGLIAIDYLRRKLNAHSFAEIDMTPFFIPEAIVVNEGLAQFPDIPSSIFSFTHHPDLIFFESNAQISGQDGITIIKTILDVARQFNVSRIFTAAAFAQSMSYQSESEILTACNTQSMLESMKETGAIPMPDGYIAGQNGLVLGVAKTRGIESACFLGTIPSYAANLAYPKASLKIILLCAKLLDIEIDLSELENNVADMDRQLAAIEERIRQFFPSNTERDEEFAHLDEEKVPQYIMDKIEKMFGEVARDHTKAPNLKQELDRWNLYELYENRFLDLFKNDMKNKKNRNDT